MATAVARIAENLRSLDNVELLRRLRLCFRPQEALPLIKELRLRYLSPGRRKREPGMPPTWEEFCLDELRMSPRTVRYWLRDATSGKNCRRLDWGYVGGVAKVSSQSHATISARNYSNAFPEYPPVVEHELGLYGVWCLRPARSSSGLWGMYPRGFLERALSLFNGVTHVLHCPSGTLGNLPKGHVTVDLISDNARQPHIRANAASLPFADCRFDLILSDPPYSENDAKKYGTPVFPEQQFLREAFRVLRFGGYLGVLHKYEMQVPIARLKRVALLAISLGNHKELRTFAIYRKES